MTYDENESMLYVITKDEEKQDGFITRVYNIPARSLHLSPRLFHSESMHNLFKRKKFALCPYCECSPLIFPACVVPDDVFKNRSDAMINEYMMMHGRKKQ